MQTPLKQVRLRRGLTQLEVSAAVAIDNSQYGRIEKGATTSSAAAARIAAYFGHEVTEMQILYPERYLLPDLEQTEERKAS